MAFGCAKNGNRQGLPRAIARAHKEYIARRGGEGGSVGEGNKQPAVVLFVVQEGENNAVDQRILEFVRPNSPKPRPASPCACRWICP